MSADRPPVAVAHLADGSRIAIYEWPPRDRGNETVREAIVRVMGLDAGPRRDPVGAAIAALDARLASFRAAVRQSHYRRGGGDA